MREGVSLTAEEKQWAREVGVAEVDQVRLLFVREVPLPARMVVNVVAGLFRCPVQPIGLAAQYGIYLNMESRNDPSLLVHELAHVAQYERLGGIRNFLRLYLEQWLRDGYWDAAMENEAREAAIPFNRPPGA